MMKKCVYCGKTIPEEAADCGYCDASQVSGPLGWWWVMIVLFPVLSLTVGYLNAGLRDSEAFNAQLRRWSITLMLVEVILIIFLNMMTL
jgi:hypothetical protein